MQPQQPATGDAPPPVGDAAMDPLAALPPGEAAATPLNTLPPGQLQAPGSRVPIFRPRDSTRSRGKVNPPPTAASHPGCRDPDQRGRPCEAGGRRKSENRGAARKAGAAIRSGRAAPRRSSPQRLPAVRAGGAVQGSGFPRNRPLRTDIPVPVAATVQVVREPAPVGLKTGTRSGAEDLAMRRSPSVRMSRPPPPRTAISRWRPVTRPAMGRRTKMPGPGPRLPARRAKPTAAGKPSSMPPGSKRRTSGRPNSGGARTLRPAPAAGVEAEIAAGPPSALRRASPTRRQARRCQGTRRRSGSELRGCPGEDQARAQGTGSRRQPRRPGRRSWPRRSGGGGTCRRTPWPQRRAAQRRRSGFGPARQSRTRQK